MSDWLDLLPNLTPKQRELARESPDPADYLLQEELAEPSEVLAAGSRFYCVAALDLSRYTPDPECLSLLSEEHARRLKALPLFCIGDRLYVAVSRPQDLTALDFVAKSSGRDVEPVLALAQDIEAAITLWMVTSEHSTDFVESIQASVSEEQIAAALEEKLQDQDAPTVRLVDHIFTQGVRMGASDIHLEPFPDKILLRYRLDGYLREHSAPPKAMYPAVVSRIKIASGLDISERRLPQDGRASITVDGKKYDLRVSIIPNLHGEGVVLRILNPHSVQLDLGSLGFDVDIQKRYEALLQLPYGIILVTGPTGSGKSTTLYATLNHISDIANKVITLEDPVEYQLPGITQIQIHPDIGYTFAEGLKAILRHDPDTVLVGEIRDLESAQIAVRAALTGHQMFSTLHTNDSLQAITRLCDMGVPLYQIMASLNGVIAQRLLRRLCPKCKQLEQPDPERLRALGLSAAEADGKVFAPVGCPDCHRLGYKGRVAIYELLEITARIRRLTPTEAQPERIREEAEKDGTYFPLQASANRKVLQGLTSLEEATSLLVGK